MDTIKIAIILICYWDNNIVNRALKSINIQTKKENLVIYMINNNSPNTIDEYQSLIQKYSKLNIKYFKAKENKGCGIARNIGLNNCSESYVIFMDDDDWFYDKYIIENYIQTIKNNKNFSAIKTHFIEQLDEFKEDILVEHHYLLGQLYNKNFLDKYNIRFNEKFLWRLEDYNFTNKILYYSKVNKYNLIYLDNNIISYVHYHSENFESLTSDFDMKKTNKIYETPKRIINIVYDIISFAEEIRFYQSVVIYPEEKQQIYNILKHVYTNIETIFKLLEKSNLKIILSKEEINNLYDSIIFLIDLIDKNINIIYQTAPYINGGENYQYISYIYFKNNFEQRWNKLTKI